MTSPFEDALCIHCGKRALVIVENDVADSYQVIALCGLCAIADVMRRQTSAPQPEPDAAAEHVAAVALETALPRKF